VVSSPGATVIDQDSVVWSADRKAFGVVFDTIGPISQPFYLLHVGDASEAEDGTVLYYAPTHKDYTVIVLTARDSFYSSFHASFCPAYSTVYVCMHAEVCF
jgi:rRNA processing protein Gar1